MKPELNNRGIGMPPFQKKVEDNFIFKDKRNRTKSRIKTERNISMFQKQDAHSITNQRLIAAN